MILIFSVVCIGLPVNGECVGATEIFGNHVGDWERNVMRFRVGFMFKFVFIYMFLIYFLFRMESLIWYTFQFIVSELFIRGTKLRITSNFSWARKFDLWYWLTFIHCFIQKYDFLTLQFYVNYLARFRFWDLACRGRKIYPKVSANSWTCGDTSCCF